MSLRAHDAPGSDAFSASESASVIDRHSEFDGTYSTDRDLRIEGRARGKLTCQGTLHVAQGATVNAEIEAEQVIVAGVLEGKVSCRSRMQVMPSGELKGQIATPTLVINEGARYEGQMQMPSQKPRLASRNRSSTRSVEDSGDPMSLDAGIARPTSTGGFIRRLGQQDVREQADSPTGADRPEAANES